MSVVNEFRNSGKIHYKCLKIINRKSKYSSNSEIKTQIGSQLLQDRFDILNKS